MQEKGILRGLLRRMLFIPSGTCPVCGRILIRTSAHLCDFCAPTLPIIQMKDCRCCGRPVLSEGSPFCEACADPEERCFSGGAVWLNYSGSARKLIAALKFGKKPILGHWIGEQMAKTVAEKTWMTELEGVVPVPLHPERQLERGYNQSTFLAEGIGKTLHLPVIDGALVRYRDTPHQLGLDREARMKNLSGAFVVKEDQKIVGRKLLLVDDVITTGSTLKECALTLLAAGAQSVYVTAAAAAPGN